RPPSLPPHAPPRLSRHPPPPAPDPLPLHAALPICRGKHPRRQPHHPRAVLPPPAAPSAHRQAAPARGHDPEVAAWRCALGAAGGDRKSTRLNSSHGSISYAVFCLKKKKSRPLHGTR